MCNFDQCTDGVARLKNFRCGTSKDWHINLYQLNPTLFVMGGRSGFLYHIKLNNPIYLIFCDFKFYRFINILAKSGRSSPGQFGARTFLSKFFLNFFVLCSLKIFLSFNCLYLGLYYLKVVCTQFFHYLFQD